MFVNNRLHLSRNFNLDLSFKKSYPTRKMWFPDLSVDDLEKKKIKLYRFMTFDKFKDLMKKRELFFAKASVLSDKFENGFQIKKFANEFADYKNYTFISCWTENDPRSESSLFMWRPDYENENHVAIEVSIDKFLSDDYTSCFLQDEDYERIEPYIGKIDYLDPENEDYPKKYEASILVPFFLKRSVFKDEREIRILIQDMCRTGPFSFKVDVKSKGKPVLIDLKKIDKFFVSPTANDDISKNVNRLIKEAGLNKTSEQVSTQIMDFDKTREKLKSISEYNNKLPDNGENFYEYELNKKKYRYISDASGNIKVEDNESDHNIESSKKKRLDIIIQSSQSDYQNDFVCHRLTKYYPF